MTRGNVPIGWRVLVSLAVVACAVALRITPEPGIVTRTLPPQTAAAVEARLPLAGAGLTPFFVCFGLLGLAAIGLRPGGAVKLRRAAPFVAVVVALIQSAFLVAWRNSVVGVWLPPPAQIVAFTAGGTLASIALGWIGTRFGVGNGYLLVYAADLGAAAPDRVPLAVAVLVVLVVGESILKRRRAVPLEGIALPVDLPLAPAGIVPLGMALAMGTLPLALVKAIGLKLPFLESPWLPGGIAAGLSVFFAFFVVALTHRPYPILHHAAGGDRERGKEWMEALDSELTRPVLANGVVLGAVALLQPFVLEELHFSPVAALWIGAIGAATLVDMRADYPRIARDAVVLGEAPGTFEADRIRRVLEAASIPCSVRGLASRQLLGAFGLFIPLTVLVRRDDETKARETIESSAPFLVGHAALDVTPAA